MIGGTIFTDYYLELKAGLLHHYTFKALSYILTVIIGENADGY
jgi:hypothetical protein